MVYVYFSGYSPLRSIGQSKTDFLLFLYLLRHDGGFWQSEDQFPGYVYLPSEKIACNNSLSI